MQQTSWFSLIPEQASSFAWQVDGLYYYITAISVFFTIGIFLALIIFAVKFREKEKYGKGADIHGSVALETAWSVIPFLIAMSIFLGGAVVYYNQYRAPADAMEIYVVGKQWMWKTQHSTGQREINELHVPVGRRIKLTMTTEDVIHSFFIPAFRTKADVVPGRYTSLWFEATKPGKYHLFCAEYCGLNHSGMVGWIYVMDQRDYDNWLSGASGNQTPVEAGKELFEVKLGCASCHEGGANQRGAHLEGLFGSTVNLSDGQTVKADEEYIRNSILNPSSQVVAGYAPIMPTFKGQVTEEQLMQLVAYIKTLGGQSGGASTTNTAAPTTGNAAANSSTTGQNPAERRSTNPASASNLASNPNSPEKTNNK